MADTIPNIVIAPDTVTNIYTQPEIVAAGVGVGDKIKLSLIGQGYSKVYVGEIAPAEINMATGYEELKPNSVFISKTGGKGLFVYSRLGCTINASVETDLLPDGLFTGTRAMTVQGYREANVKNGLEFEGSTLLNLAGGVSNNTIFVTGNLPVSLKSRSISYTGDGVKSEIFELPTYTGGVSVAYQNANANFTPLAEAVPPAIGLASILVGATVTDDGVLKFAPAYGIGNVSNQGNGATNESISDEHILKENTAYLLKLTSLDAQSQQIASFLTWYEGLLDLSPA